MPWILPRHDLADVQDHELKFELAHARLELITTSMHQELIPDQTLPCVPTDRYLEANSVHGMGISSCLQQGIIISL